MSEPLTDAQIIALYRAACELRFPIVERMGERWNISIYQSLNGYWYCHEKTRDVWLCDDGIWRADKALHEQAMRLQTPELFETAIDAMLALKRWDESRPVAPYSQAEPPK